MTDRELKLATPIENLDLSTGPYNCLRREGIRTVGRLITWREDELLDIRNLGAKSLAEIKEALSGMGLALAILCQCTSVPCRCTK